MLARFRKIAYLLAYIVATIPFWHYIRDTRILALMTLVIVFAYINVVLSTVDAAQSIISSEKAKTPLPRWLADKPKYQKWWMLVRHTLKWHLLLIPAKMGLALGFAEWLVINNIPEKYYVFREIYQNGGNLDIEYPQWETCLIALSLITLFAFWETCFIASLVSLTNNLRRKSKQTIFVIFLRTTLILSSIGLVFLTRIESGGEYQVYGWTDCDTYQYSITINDLNLRGTSQVKCVVRQVLETGYLALMTSSDQSILLSANIMRPLKIYSNDFPDWTDNRLFVARQIVAGILGLLLYAGITWGVLWFVEDEKDISSA